MPNHTKTTSTWCNFITAVPIFDQMKKKRLQIGPQTCTHWVVCGNKDKCHFPFLPQMTLRTYWDIQRWVATKPKLPTTFPGARNPDGRRGTFFHTLSLHTYVYAHHNNEWSPRTISHHEQDESVNRTCFSGETAAFSYSVRQQQAAWGTDKKGLQTKEAITALSLCMSAFQRPLSAAEETKTMPSVLLGNWCVTFIRCLGSVWGEEGSWGGEGGRREWRRAARIQSWRVWSK